LRPHTLRSERVKMRVVLALLSLSALGQGVALRDPAIDEYIAAILELLKTQMPTGIPDLGIPPLDPFEVPHFDIDPIEVSDPVPININITIDDFVIKNLATFETQLAHLDLEGLGLELNLTLADLRGDATYSLDGTALGIFPIYGDGPMYLELFGVTLHAKAAVLINADGFVEITEMDIAADFDDIAVHLDNLVGGGNFGETINNILNLLGPMIWDLVKGYLFPFLDEILLKVLNDALAGCNIADLVQNGSCFQERLADILKNHSEMPFPLFKSGVYH